MVRRLRDAGAVILGKTTLPELAICGFTESKTLGHHPQPVGHRPHARRLERRQRRRGRRRPGRRGASASDGAGSIRIPAAFCGLFGLKPQRGGCRWSPHDHWHGMSAAAA